MSNPNTPSKRAGLPTPDRQHPGQYLQMSPQTHPKAFRTPSEQVAWRARRAEVERYLYMSHDAGTAAAVAMPTLAGAEESEAFSEPDNLSDVDWQPGPAKRRSTTTKPRAAAAATQVVSNTSPNLIRIPNARQC